MEVPRSRTFSEIAPQSHVPCFRVCATACIVDTFPKGMGANIRLRPAKAGGIEQRFFGRVTSMSLRHGRSVTEILREHIAAHPEDYVGFLTELGAVSAETGNNLLNGRVGT
jgi:hypothetical protein